MCIFMCRLQIYTQRLSTTFLSRVITKSFLEYQGFYDVILKITENFHIQCFIIFYKENENINILDFEKGSDSIFCIYYYNELMK
mgnify:CR=1 FL=1